jgi:two-component system, NarL family, nitrate/nitrite response regulator NarL
MSLLLGHPLPPVADGLAAMLSERLGVTEVRTATDSEDFLHAARADVPDAAVLDVELDPGNEVTLCTALGRIAIPVVVITRPDSVNYLELLSAGAKGICPISDGLEGVSRALVTVLEGDTYVPAHLLGAVLRDLITVRRETVPQSSAVDRLSPRERQVLGLLGAGADHVEIASRLTISPNTAKTHINRLLGKLDVRSRVEAASLAVAHGITPADDGGTT